MAQDRFARLATALLAMLLGSLAVGCARHVSRATTRTGPSIAPSITPAQPPESPVDRMVSIYGAVIRVLAAPPGTKLGPSLGLDFKVDYVVDAIDDFPPTSTAAGPGTLATLPAQVKEGLKTALAPLPIQFVADRKSVIGPAAQGSVVQGGGQIITLGPIPQGSQTVEVRAGAYCAELCALAVTFVVERTEGGWKVTGTTGQMGIA